MIKFYIQTFDNMLVVIELNEMKLFDDDSSLENTTYVTAITLMSSKNKKK